jgi:hypothetical protein
MLTRDFQVVKKEKHLGTISFNGKTFEIFTPQVSGLTFSKFDLAYAHVVKHARGGNN